MNLILFNNSELNTKLNSKFNSELNSEFNIDENTKIFAFLPRNDERTVHLLKVLHKGVGSSFDAGVLGEKTGNGTILEITPTGLSVALDLKNDPLPRTPLRLGVGFPRPIQLRRLLRDCASLGLSAVDLIGTELGEKSYRNTKLLDDGGARSALIEGAVQARDTRLPELTVFRNLTVWLDKIMLVSHNDHILIAADNVRPQGSFSKLETIAPEKTVILAVGSERGWSDKEREQLENAGFIRLSLGARALRTETACIASAILVIEKMGLLN